VLQTLAALLPLPSGYRQRRLRARLAFLGIDAYLPIAFALIRLIIPGHDCIVTLVKEPGSDEIKVNMMIRKKPDGAEGDKPSSSA
jgi:hypothetical protein